MAKNIELKARSVNGNVIISEQGDSYKGEGNVEKYIKKSLEGHRVRIILKKDDENVFTFLEDLDRNKDQKQEKPQQQESKQPAKSQDQNLSFKVSYAKDIVVAMINNGMVTNQKEISDAMLANKLLLDELL